AATRADVRRTGDPERCEASTPGPDGYHINRRMRLPGATGRDLRPDPTARIEEGRGRWRARCTRLFSTLHRDGAFPSQSAASRSRRPARATFFWPSTGPPPPDAGDVVAGNRRRHRGGRATRDVPLTRTVR